MQIVMSIFGQNKEDSFWKWFQQNEEKIFNFEKHQNEVFKELNNELHKINNNLTFEFGPVENNIREFVISADGIKSAFPSVEKLYEKIPKLKYFVVIKLRPRRKILNDLQISNKEIKVNTVKYLLFKDENPKKIGILLFFENYEEATRDIYVQFGYLFLDEALGEYDVETKVGAIDFTSYNSEYFNKSKSLTELAIDFDNYFE